MNQFIKNINKNRDDDVVDQTPFSTYLTTLNCKKHIAQLLKINKQGESLYLNLLNFFSALIFQLKKLKINKTTTKN